MNTSCPDRLRAQAPSLDGLQSPEKLSGLAGRALSVCLSRGDMESYTVKRQQCFLPEVSVYKETKCFLPSERKKKSHFLSSLFFKKYISF